MDLRKAKRLQAKIRVNLSGISGSGKTYSALLLAHGMVQDWTKIALIDTENKSGDLYSDLGEYNVITLEPPYSPERFIKAIETCEKAGMEVIIIDSTTHEWDGSGGCLEIVDMITKSSRSGNSYIAWGEVTPRHKKFLEKIIASPCHMITTTRKKNEYSIEKDNGKTIIKKMGTKEIQREGFEYEFTIAFDLSREHFATTEKDRTRLFSEKDPFIITEDTGKEIMDWCNSGHIIVPPTEEQTKDITKLAKERGFTDVAIIQVIESLKSTEEAEEKIKKLKDIPLLPKKPERIPNPSDIEN